jgi:hypothetical protein
MAFRMQAVYISIGRAAKMCARTLVDTGSP